MSISAGSPVRQGPMSHDSRPGKGKNAYEGTREDTTDDREEDRSK